MKKAALLPIILAILSFWALPATQLRAHESAVYGGGIFYSGDIPVVDDLRTSDFATVTLWTIHVGPQGNMNFNHVPRIDTAGEHARGPRWGARTATLRSDPTGVTRTEIGFAPAGVNDFANIGSLIAAQGTESDTVLYKAFDNLKTIIGTTARGGATNESCAKTPRAGLSDMIAFESMNAACYPLQEQEL